MIVCGIMNHGNHDSGACIMRWNPGAAAAPEWVAISEERLARVKWAYFSPIRSLVYCMDAFGIKDPGEIDWFVLDWRWARRLINTNPAYRKLETDYVLAKLNVPPDKIVFADSHHLAHAASAFYPSCFEEAAVLVVDGVGSDMETVSLYRGRGCELTLLERGRFYGPGLLYTMVTRHLLGFGTGEEGKTMGLAPFGRLAMGPILNCAGTYEGLDLDYSQFLDRLPERFIRQPGLVPCRDRKRVTDEYYARIAYDTQKETERAMLYLARYAAERTGSVNLCLAGGVALNCVANSVVLESGLFRNVFIQPAASDTGVPYGLALLGYHQFGKGTVRGAAKVYTGISYPRAEILALLKKFRIRCRTTTNKQVARLLAQGRIVGWLTGGSEYGPRALGHRSILADPRDPGMKDLLNAKVKHREAYRPFAPSVLNEHAGECFELDVESPYMLLAPKVRPEAVKNIPAVVHVDQTARVQTVSERNCPVYYDLLRQFYRLTGVPVLLNTSFNDNDEPIVETPLDALLCFMRTKMDYLVLEGVLIDKRALSRRASSLTKKLSAYQDRLLLDQYAAGVDRCCRGYQVGEMVQYLTQEEIKGRYHADYSAMDRLEEKLWEWALQKRRVIVICDQEHLASLKGIKPYVQANVVQVLLTEDKRDAVSKMDLSPAQEADAVLICLYNMAFWVREKVQGLTRGEAYIPYLTYSKNLTRSAVVAGKTDQPSNLEGLTDVSNEGKRSKDWDKFFRRVKAGL